MRPVLAIWLIALLSLTNISSAGLPSHMEQDESPLTFEAYWEFVGSTRQAIGQMDALADEGVRAGLDELAAQWDKVTAVEFPDQTLLQIDTSYLVTELQANPPDLEHLKNLMDALFQAHENYPQDVFTIQDIEPLKDIFALPEFQWGEAQMVTTPNWLQKILDGFFDMLERFIYAIQNTVYYGRIPLMIVAAILFAISLLYIYWSLSRSLVRNAELAAEGSEGDAILTSKGALQRAQTLSTQGDYRNAMRYLYLSSLLILDERGLLRYDRSRTNREYLRSVSSKPELATPLRDVIDVFDRVWYGYESVDEQTYQSFVEHVDELREKKE